MIGPGGTTTTKDPGVLTVLDLTLPRPKSDTYVRQWRDDTIRLVKGFKRDVNLEFLDSQGAPTGRRFTLTGAWPSKYSASSSLVRSQLNSPVREVETFTLVADGFTRVQ
jgi:hypothetical protein